MKAIETESNALEAMAQCAQVPTPTQHPLKHPLTIPIHCAHSLSLSVEEHAGSAGRGFRADHLRPLARAQPRGDPGADAAHDLHAVAGT